MRRALRIFEATFGNEAPNVADALNNLAQLLKTTNRLIEAEPLMRRALKIDEQSYEEDHPVIARDLFNLVQLLQATNRLAEAEPLIPRVAEILLKFTRETGHPHPLLLAAIGNYAFLLEQTGNSEEDIWAFLERLTQRFGVDLHGI